MKWVWPSISLLCSSWPQPPLLAVITELSACDSEEEVAWTIHQLENATAADQVDLIQVRVSKTEGNEARVTALIQGLQEIQKKRRSFRLTVTSDWWETAIQLGADGVHVKEAIRAELVPKLMRSGIEVKKMSLGTSVHSPEANIDPSINYLFVGTCYPTPSHPEKTVFEGPSLPGFVKAELVQDRVCFAIGGIGVSNCHEPIELGADGVAVISAVMQSNHPAATVADLKTKMRLAYEKRQTDC